MTKILIDRSTVEQALEALYEETAWFGPTPKGAAAITALNAALAAPQIDPVDEYRKGFIAGQIDMRDRDQAQTVQEPVAWMTVRLNVPIQTTARKDVADEWLKWGEVLPLYTAPPQRPAEPVQETETVDQRAVEPFVVKHYIADDRPSIKGNGFDGLTLGDDREEADRFVAWINARISAPPQRKPVEWDGRCMLGHCNSPAGCENSGECRAIERAHNITGDNT